MKALRTRKWIVAVVMALSLFPFVTITSSTPPAWEYRVVEISADPATVRTTLNDRLQMEGAAGWELVSMTPAGELRYILIFKHLKQDHLQPHA